MYILRPTSDLSAKCQPISIQTPFASPQIASLRAFSLDRLYRPATPPKPPAPRLPAPQPPARQLPASRPPPSTPQTPAIRRPGRAHSPITFGTQSGDIERSLDDLISDGRYGKADGQARKRCVVSVRTTVCSTSSLCSRFSACRSSRRRSCHAARPPPPPYQRADDDDDDDDDSSERAPNDYSHSVWQRLGH